MQILGAHLSTSGGLEKTFDLASQLGITCLQIFSASPRDWKTPVWDPEKIAKFQSLKESSEIKQVYFHANYLINLADAKEIGKKSVIQLIAELNLAHILGVRGSVVHLGSFLDHPEDHIKSIGLKVLLANIETVLQNTPQDTVFIIENSGTRKIGLKLEEIEFLLSALKNPRVKVCLDTCHLHAAGFDLTTAEKFEDFLSKLEENKIFESLELVHLNDSRDQLGSKRDRHANLGKGHVGESVFKNFLTHPKTKDLPYVLEVPGFDGKGPDLANCNLVRSWLC